MQHRKKTQDAAYTVQKASSDGNMHGVAILRCTVFLSFLFFVWKRGTIFHRIVASLFDVYCMLSFKLSIIPCETLSSAKIGIDRILEWKHLVDAVGFSRSIRANWPVTADQIPTEEEHAANALFCVAVSLSNQKRDLSNTSATHTLRQRTQKTDSS